MTMLRSFKQFFTPKKYSQIIIDELNISTPNKIIDLTIGEGSLLKAAFLKWDKSIYFGNDIDINCCNQISYNCNHIQCFNKDIFLDFSIIEIIKQTGMIDLCLGNPPFHLIEQNKDTQNILNLFNLQLDYRAKFVPAEVIFILQCIRITADNGTVALVLPDGFFTTSYLKPFRRYLVNSYNIELVKELPDAIFKHTKAKTHILVFKKQKNINQKIKLKSTINPKCISISLDEAIERMDYSYYENSFYSSIINTIESNKIEIFRGVPKFKIEKINPKHILHTTNFSSGNIFSNRLRTRTKLLKYERRIAMPGDIIVSRVGSSCVGRVGLVGEGYFVATDCVFVIRVKDISIRRKLYSSLKSDVGQKWIIAHSKGVAARHITLNDIKLFPLDIEDQHVI